jgi:lysophospholipase L1-like esterase
MKKLILFGDSLFGRFGKERISSLEIALKDYDVYNCAAGGWNSDDCVKKAPYISKLKPDVLVISLGTNDSAPWKQLPLSTFAQNLPKIFETFSSSKIIYFLPPPVNESKLAEEKKDFTNAIVKQYYDAIRQACQSHSVIVLDSWRIFMPMLEAGQDYHDEDGIHLNDLAYKTITSELAKLLA